MKLLNTVTLNKPVASGASVAILLGEVDSLSDDEIVELAQLLRARFPDRFGP